MSNGVNQKGFIKDIVIIVLGVLLLGGGYFYFSKKPAYAPAENSNISQKVANETVGWKTYRNEKYGFEFSYPLAWPILVSDDQAKLGLWTPENWKDSNTLNSYTDFEILLNIWTNPKSLSFDEWSKSIQFWESPKKIILGNKLSAWLAVKPGLGDGDHVIYISSADNSFFIQMDVPWSYQNDLMLKKVINSFKFTK